MLHYFHPQKLIRSTPDQALIHYKNARNVDLFSSKYNSKRIKVRTPNIVIVFSNDEPNTSKLAKDRWKLFCIENDELKERYI